MPRVKQALVARLRTIVASRFSTLLTAAVLLLLISRAHADEKNSLMAARRSARLIVVEHKVITPRQGHREVRAAVEHAAEAAGLTLARSKKPRPDLYECQLPLCAQKLKSATNATHGAAIDAAYSEETFSIRLTLFELPSARPIVEETRTCEGCTFKDFLGAMRDHTTRLVDRGFPLNASTSSAAVAIRPVKKGVDDQTANLAALDPKKETAKERDTLIRANEKTQASTYASAPPPVADSKWAPRLTFAVSTVVALTGLVFLALENRPKDCMTSEMRTVCPHLWDTKTMGLVLTSVGSAGLLSTALWQWLK